MELSGKRVVVTGAAGLVGSHLADALAADNDVLAVDNLSKGTRDRVPDGVEFRKADVRDSEDVADVITQDVDIVFHFAAYTDTNYGEPRQLFEENTEMTYNVLERMREVGVDHLAFTSSSTVYGEAPMPTPEDYAPLEPISVYGASKLADEGLISTYANSYGIQSWVYRFANIVGPRQRGNVVPDFIEKLLDDPETLTILGDGRQEKSYMHVEECVDAMTHVVEHADGVSERRSDGSSDECGESDGDYHVYNLGTRTTTSVNRIADIVADELGVDPDYEYTGGDRGWTGDVPKMRLSIEKLAALGWEPGQSSDEAVRTAARGLVEELRAERQ